MEIIGVGRIDRRLPAQFIRCSIANTTLDTTTGQPRGEGIRIMIPTLAVFSLGGRLAAKFSSADHQRFIQKPARLEILEQRRGTTIEHTPPVAMITR